MGSRVRGNDNVDVDDGGSFKQSPFMRTIYLNGNYTPETEGKVSIFDRGFLFSDAVYEVVSVLDGKLVDFDGHVQRLVRSLAEIGIKGAPGADDWLAPEDRDFVFPSADTLPTVLAFTQSRTLADNPLAQRGIRVITMPDLRWGRADIKTTQLLYASMMKNEAIARGADDAWMERNGWITEGSAQNAHIITHEGVLVTHPLTCEILHGITRASVLPLVAQHIEERPFSIHEAEQAAEAFMSSASGFVMPVVKINGQLIGNGQPGSATVQLRHAYIDWARRTAI
jgi:D-alanine transaminase